MVTTFIHIGLQKTGTTFLDRSMSRLRPELAKLGIIYPDTAAGLGVAGPAGHHFVSQAVHNRRTGFTPDADFSLLKTHVAALKAEIAKGKTGVISSETFSTLSREKQVARVRSLFPEDDVKIIVYLRRQDAWVDSLYGQMIKVGRKEGIDAFIESVAKTLDYGALVDRWAKHFGSENIVVRNYEREGLWADFMTSIGHPEAAKIEPPTASVNDSLPPQLALFAQNIPNYKTDRRMRRVLESVAEYFPSPQGLKYLSSERGALLLRECSEGNARVARDYCGRETLFADETPLPFVGIDSLTPEQFAAIQGAVSIRLLERIAKLQQNARMTPIPWTVRLMRKIRK